jgi:hypothetical protein
MTQGTCGCLAIKSESSNKNMIPLKANIPEKSPVLRTIINIVLSLICSQKTDKMND